MGSITVLLPSHRSAARFWDAIVVLLSLLAFDFHARLRDASSSRAVSAIVIDVQLGLTLDTLFDASVKMLPSFTPECDYMSLTTEQLRRIPQPACFSPSLSLYCSL
ncbi:hypothetical protein BD310DRAFT_548756 [Dichomitus squalens]|uniref:Uncharacterized protein n=1 Tax=Dichomitus squalens TaxID=114155 RepID=A0A4Q9PT14_9APHY|nr:hypothetical protein BD310DRAFT_548756 [Dichomitus squalens]